MKHLDFLGKRVLVTGGSRGIGKEIAIRFAQEGANLVLVARDKDQLRKTAGQISSEFGVDVQSVAQDLTEDDAPSRIFDKVTADIGEIFALANNAGASRFGSFVKMKPEIDLSLIKLNVIAPEFLTKLFLPQMIERRDGGILFTSSTAAFFPGPKLAVYHATKAFVQSFAESLYEKCNHMVWRLPCCAQDSSTPICYKGPRA